MEEILTPLNIISWILGVIGLGIGAYKSFNTPQSELDKREAINDEKTNGKASVLAQQVKWEKEANEKRFAEMGTQITSAMTIAQNHIHTVDTKVDNLGAKVGDVEKSIVRLTTIIEERIPLKK